MASKPKLKWNGGKILAKTHDQLERNMGEVVQMLRADVITSINVTQPMTRSRKGSRRGLSPSAAGDPPKRVEGDLVRSITADVRSTPSKITGAYGSTQTKKALSLEFGTSRMAARPFLRPPMLRRLNDIKRILAK